jgi:hypothetical protein
MDLPNEASFNELDTEESTFTEFLYSMLGLALL